MAAPRSAAKGNNILVKAWLLLAVLLALSQRTSAQTQNCVTLRKDTLIEIPSYDAASKHVSISAACPERHSLHSHRFVGVAGTGNIASVLFKARADRTRCVNGEEGLCQTVSSCVPGPVACGEMRCIVNEDFAYPAHAASVFGTAIVQGPMVDDTCNTAITATTEAVCCPDA